MRELLTEGKTKKIWKIVDVDNRVAVESKDDITAGDGARHNIIKGKGEYCNIITCNVFRLLHKNDIPNHFIRKSGKRFFLADKLEMIDIEVILRGIATGSYPKRAGIAPETIFKQPKVELNFKCDKLHDPIIEWSDDRNGYVLYDAHKPRRDGFLGILDRVLARNELDKNDFVLPKPEKIPLIMNIALQSFLCVEKAWRKLDVIIPDIKVEMGYTSDRKILLGDVMDNDSWRARLLQGDGISWEEMSKQVYRDLPIITPEWLEVVRKKYQKMAELSAKLV